MSAASNDLEKLKAATNMGWLETLSCVGLAGGTAISLCLQPILATVPLSVLLSWQIFSRQRKIAAIVEHYQGTAQCIEGINQEVQQLSNQYQDTLHDYEGKFDTLNQDNNKHSLESITLKEILDEQSNGLAKYAGQLDALEETLSSLKEIMASNSMTNQSASAESHFTRGTHQEKLGYLDVAIEDYSQAIEREEGYAEAYLRRGIAKSQLGRKQSAVIDLNLATKYFFESGDLVNYQQAKDIAANIHKVPGQIEKEDFVETDHNTKKSDLVTINGMFGED